MIIDYKKLVSKEHCTLCHGEGDGFKCAKCGQTSDKHDPNHWRKCEKEGKMQVKCKKCGEAEQKCSC